MVEYRGFLTVRIYIVTDLKRYVVIVCGHAGMTGGQKSHLE